MDEILATLIAKIEQLPYNSGLEFERACEQIFVECGFVNMATPQEPDIFKQWGKDPSLPNDKTLIREDRFDECRFLELYDDHLFYLAQPCGSSSPPDFILVIYGRIVPFECKSTQKRKYRFNNTLPHPTTVYAFTSQIHNKTRVAMGRDLISHHAGLEIERITKEELSAAHKRIQERTKNIPGNPYKFEGYGREQYGQTGGMETEDFVVLSEQNKWRLGVLVHLLRELRMSKYFELDDVLL